MNKSYRTVWNEVLGAWVAVSEATRARGKRSQTAVLAGAVLLAAAGTVQAQNVTLSGSNGRMTYTAPCDTITVPSTCATENRYVQPDSSGATLGVSGALLVGANLSNSNSGPAVNGSLSITNGGTASGGRLYAGYEGGTNGTVLIDGAGSRWNGGGTISIGNYGSASMTLSDGGYAGGTNGYVGNFAGSESTATVTGIGGGTRSTWQSTGSLYVGDNNDFTATDPTPAAGKGVLMVSDGGLVASKSGYIGGRTGSGAVTVVGVNSGTSSEWAMTGQLVVGNTATGTLNVMDGGQVHNATLGTIGMEATAVGTATVSGIHADGTRSTWTNGNALSVGNRGTGTLNILDGALVNSTSGSIGTGAGGVGTANVRGVHANGTASTWASTGTLTVGNNGTGALNVTDGGQVTATGGLMLSFGSGASSTMTVSGVGSKVSTNAIATIGNQGESLVTVTKRRRGQFGPVDHRGQQRTGHGRHRQRWHLDHHERIRRGPQRRRHRQSPRRRLCEQR